MKRQLFFAVVAAFVMSFSLEAMAQAGSSTSGKASIGYAKYDDAIWEYDGLSLDRDARVGCAIVITRDMLEPYIGGTITGMRVGWDTSTETGKYNGFVRNSFTGEDLSTGTATVRYSYSDTNPGWNNMTMSKYVIPEDVEQLVVGFTTNLKKDLCAIPTLYPHGVNNSNYLWVEGDVDAQGNPNWVNMSDRGILPILLIVQDTQGKFNFLPVVQSIMHDGVVRTDQPGGVLLRLKNSGSVTISSIEVTSRQGEDVKSQQVNLTKSIAPGMTGSTTLVPFFGFRPGEVEFSISKVNNQEISRPVMKTFNTVVIPAAVADQYKRRPLVEYYESENNYMAPRYYDNYVGPVLENRFDEFTYVSQHLDDQFMTGEDDATVLALALCDNDSSAVSLPSMAVDRAIDTGNISFQMGSAWNALYAVLLEPYASNYFNSTLENPTFLDVNVSGTVGDDNETLTVTVGGDGSHIPECLPEGEKPCLTVYLMERNVTSDSQLFWTDSEKEATMGEYTHVNVIREILTDPLGDELESANEIKGTYTTTLDPTWNKENLYLVAFVHRSSKNDYDQMQVFNSNEGAITFTSGIRDAVTTNANAGDGIIYDLQGRRALRSAKGIFIRNGRKVIVK